MDFQAFLDDIRSSPDYSDQIVYVREQSSREPEFAEPSKRLPPQVQEMLKAQGIERLYTHQAEAIDLAREGKNVLVVTGTASGKSLCYTVPIIETLLADPEAKILLLFPTKALCQDQYQRFAQGLGVGGWGTGKKVRVASDCAAKQAAEAGSEGDSEVFSFNSLNVLAGVFDGDTPSTMRRKLRDHASIIFTNPDIVHSGIMPQHARWASFLSKLKLVVIDEFHIYSGIFGSNMGNLMRRFHRICAHYNSTPQFIACSATIGNPKELVEEVMEREFSVVDNDGSPKGKRTYVFWNPPRIKNRNWRSRQSANVEAHDLMAMLVQRGVPTITFSKAKMTAEMIHRYVCEKLQNTAPHLIKKVSPYRGGYLPEERREIEQKLFSGELIGVSTTPALELGIDVGGLDASVLVGYPGTLASFYQQSGRAGRKDRDALVILVGLDTSVNQYIMSNPEYIFGRPLEQGVIDVNNPFVITGHLRCAAHEKPLEEPETRIFGPYSQMVLKLLEENMKLKNIDGKWYHAAPETPQHEITLRDHCDKTVVIEDINAAKIIGEVHRYDAPPLLHREAIYMHQGETYRVLSLDMERNIAKVKRDEVDYYTQAIGGTDVHHVDHSLRGKPFGSGNVNWGEVTAYFGTAGYEKIHFYTLDAISRHPVDDVPSFCLETMALWIVPPEDLMAKVRLAGLDAYNGLRGIGYATRMVLPLFMTCDTLDFSHTVGSVNSPWNTVFIYERYPHGLGFTEKAYERLHDIMPSVYENIKKCTCEDGCPCCVGKPLRKFTVHNVERGEAAIPSKASTLMILEGLLGDYSNLDNPDTCSLVDTTADDTARLERALRRRLETAREPKVFHPIEPKVQTEYPDIEKADELSKADVQRRSEIRRSLDRDLRKRIAKKLDEDKINPNKSRYEPPPPGMTGPGGVVKPTAFPGKPAESDAATGGRGDGAETVSSEQSAVGSKDKPLPNPPPQGEGAGSVPPKAPIQTGDSMATKARRLKKLRGDADEKPQ